MESLVNSMKSAALSVGQYFTPVLRESKFKETGVLTPEEFVAAGDHLVHHCPTWSWSNAVDESRSKNYLPADKQFLITRNVPCHMRCLDMEYDPSQERILSKAELDDEDGFTNVDDDDEGWVDTHHHALEFAPNAIMFTDSPGVNNIDQQVNDEEGPAMDMDAFIAGGGLEDDDPNRFVEKREPKSTANEDNIIHTRTYDLHITYDKYYQVPRLWLYGYDEQNKPLSTEKMNDDFSQDHINKTITMETHPHLHDTQMASIHPCKHAEVMKRLMEQLAESGRVLTVEQYLVLFLKFVQAIIPTIEYDYTRGIQL